MKIIIISRFSRGFLATCTAITVLGGLVALLPGWVSAQNTPDYAPGEVLVKLKKNVLPNQAQAVFKRLNAKSVERLGDTGWFRVRLDSDTASVQGASVTVKSLPGVAASEPNYVVRAIAIPNDPSFGSLWGLHNTGQNGGVAGADIDAPEAWDTFGAGAGNTVPVAVIDTGIDFNHPDLRDRIWTNPNEIAGNGVDDDRNGYVDDVRGWDFVNNDNNPQDDNRHGTHCAGTIAATFNNGTGVAGAVGPAKVRIMPLKFLNAQGSGYTSAAVKALDYATTKGALISNNSWGGGSFSQALADAITRNHQAGGLFIAAAGNSAQDSDARPYYPQGYNVPNVISVASMTAQDRLSSFSNYGARSVDLAAPGSQILSTLPGGGYGNLSGTSMAAPHVVGGAALLMAYKPSLTGAQVKQILMSSVRKVGYLSGNTVSGGVLNLKNALAMAGNPGSPPPPGPGPDPTPPPPPPPTSGVPAAPSNVTVKGVIAYGMRSAEIKWDDNSVNETGFEVWESPTPDRGFTLIKVLRANKTYYLNIMSFSPLKSDYYFKVRAINSTGPSAFSSVVKLNRF